MSRYYGLGFEAGAADFEQGSYEDPGDMVFDSAMSADDCKDYITGYYNGWRSAKEDEF